MIIEPTRLCGFLYLFILVTNAASVGLGNSIGKVDAVTKLRSINDNPKQFQINIVTAIISHISILALAGMLFFVFSSHNLLLAAVGTIFRFGEGLILIRNEINSMNLLNIAKEYAVAGDAEKLALSASGNVILHTKNSGFTRAMTLLAIGALAYCILLLSSGAIPMLIGWLGLIASIVAVVGTVIKFVAPSFEIPFTIGFLLMMLFEVSFGGWLLITGMKSSI